MTSSELRLRGKRYFASVDTRLSAPDRINLIMGELRAASTAIEHSDRNALGPNDLLCYLGILDNAKQQSLSLFHAIMYNERHTGITTDPAILSLRQQLLTLATGFTRGFYEACLGRPFSSLPSLATVDACLEHIQQLAPAIDPAGLKIQELDHPLKVMLSAHSIAEGAPADTVVGFPSGGTQLAIATALAIELIHNLPPHNVNLLSIPLSLHSGTIKSGFIPTSDQDLHASVDYFARAITGKHVIIVDDNSSTGSTMDMGSRSIMRLSPASVRLGVGEIDPKRMLVRAHSANNSVVSHVADLRHQLFESASGVAPITSRDVQLRKELAGKILRLPSWNRTNS